MSRIEPAKNQGWLAGQECWLTSRSMRAAATATVRLAPGYTAGEQNVLLKSVKNTLTSIGNYRMSFGLTVTCTTCP